MRRITDAQLESMLANHYRRVKRRRQSCVSLAQLFVLIHIQHDMEHDVDLKTTWYSQGGQSEDTAFHYILNFPFGNT